MAPPPPPPPAGMGFATPEPSRGGGRIPSSAASVGMTPRTLTLNELEQSLQRLQRENFDLKMTIYYQEDHIKSLKGGAFDEEEHIKSLEDQLIEKDYDVQTLEREKEELSEMLLRSKEMLSTLKQDLQYKDREGDDLGMEVVNFQHRISELEQELRVRKSQEQSLLERVDGAEETVQAQELAIQRLQEEKALASSKNQQLEWQIETLTSEQERLRGEYERELEDARATARAMEQDVERQAQSSHRVSSDAEALRKKIVAAEERARAQQEQVLECQHKIERLMDVLKEKEAQVQAAKQEAARAWQQADSKSSEVESLQAEVEEREAQLLQLQRDKRQLQDEARNKLESGEKSNHALLESMSELRQEHARALKDVLGQLGHFSTALDCYVDDLVHSLLPAGHEQAEEGESSSRGALDSSSSSGPKQQVKELVGRWTARVKLLSAVKKHVQETMTSVTSKQDRRATELEMAIAELQLKLQAAEKGLQDACRQREGEERRRVEEVGRLQAQLAEERERAEQREAVQRHELEGKVCDREARLRDTTEKHRQEKLRLEQRWHEAEQQRQESVGQAKRLQEACHKLTDQVARLQADLSQHQQVKATVQRLVRQVRQRDDKIVQLQQLLVREGGLLHVPPHGVLTSLEGEDEHDVAITGLMDGSSSSTTHPDTTAVMMGTGPASSTMEELVHQQIEETRISMQQTADKLQREKLRLSRSGGSGGGGGGVGLVAAELEARVEQLGLWVRELQHLAADTKALTHSFEESRSSLLLRGGSSGGGARPVWLEQAEQGVSSLLSQNGRLVKGFETLCQDLQRIYRRLKSADFGRTASSSTGSSPRRSSSRGENDRNLGNTTTGVGPPRGFGEASGSGVRYHASGSDRRAPLSSRGDAADPHPSSSSSSARYPRFPTAAHSSGAAGGFSHSGGSSHGSSGGGDSSLPRQPVVLSSSGGRASSRALVAATASSSAVHPGVHNLEKISHDLQEIAHKLELYKATATRTGSGGGATDFLSRLR